MKFGLRYCNTGDYVDPAKAVALAQAAEEAGFESMWTVEHTVVPAAYESTYPYAASGKMAGGKDDFLLPDPLIWMAYVAAATRRVKLATGIMILPQHNPVVVAKQVATLDHLSGGRVLLGIGVGWLKEEFDALGVPFDDRGRRTDEYMQAMRELWGAEKPIFRRRVRPLQGHLLPPAAGKRTRPADRRRPFQGAAPSARDGSAMASSRRAARRRICSTSPARPRARPAAIPTSSNSR